MKKKIIIIAGILLALIIAYECYAISSAVSIKGKTLDYLNELSYTEDMIESIEIKNFPINRILGYNEWKIETVFKDLPDLTFWLTYKDKQIMFQGVTGSSLLSKEETIEYMNEFKTSSLFKEKDPVIDNEDAHEDKIESLEDDKAINLPNSAFRVETNKNSSEKIVENIIDDTPVKKNEPVNNNNDEITVTQPEVNDAIIVHDPKKSDSENKIVTNDATLTWNDERTIFTVSVKGNPTTGYNWELKSNGKWAICDENPEYISDAKQTSDPRFQLVGAGGTYIFNIKIDESKLVKNDTNIVTLDYLRSWEGEPIDSISISFTSHDDGKVYADILK